ncbi:MAG: Mn transporter [Spirochaetes bacterium RBG_13_68_11]|nr:MAG: Mn transporter [Spirochaetes bacterium RBG_13_68_11]
MRRAHRLRPLAARLALLLSVIGPGIITANVDNDAGGITTYSVAGAHFGYAILWIMPLVAVALIIVQEMSARLGVMTGKGLADLIRESLGVRITAIVLGLLLVANLANTVSEFAGVAASMEIFGVSKLVSVPIAAVLVWLLIVRGNYRTVERVFLAASAVYLCYVLAGFLERPDWSAIGRSVVTPVFRLDRDYIVILVTIVGTTIAPWMQFYQQSAIADKGLKPSDYAYERVDVVLGSLFAVFVAVFITISCAATLHASGARIETAKDAALALRSLAGPFSGVLFAVGLLNASLFSAAILPLSTAYVVCEAFGWESGVSRRIREAPVFFGIFTAFIVMGAGIVLMPQRSLIEVMMLSQTMNGILLPVILVVMLLLVNDRRLMGERFANGKVLNAVTIAVVAALTALTGLLVVTSLRV